VVAECTGQRISYWSAAPNSGWATLQPQVGETSVKTGFSRGEQTVLVSVGCHGDGTPDIQISSRGHADT
jgi:hypothetical protein